MYVCVCVCWGVGLDGNEVCIQLKNRDREMKECGREEGREREIVSKSRSGPGGVQTVSMLF